MIKVRSALLPILLALLTTQSTISTATSHSLPTVHVFQSYGAAAIFFLDMGPDERIVLTRNASLTASLLNEIGFPTKVESVDRALPSSIEPQELAYILLYLKEHSMGINNAEKISENIESVIKELSSKRSDAAVLFYSSDGPVYSLLAAYTAFLRKAKLLDVDSITPPLKPYLRGVRFVMLVTQPLTSENYRRYSDSVTMLTRLDEDPYLDSSLGILTGDSIASPFIMLLSKDAVSAGMMKNLRGISLLEDLPLARKVEFVGSLYGLDSKIFHPDVKYSNLTYKEVSKILSNSKGGVLYLNLHGNPYLMALRTDGNVVLTPSIVKSSKPLGTVVMTLSCDTLRFQDLRDPEESVAYSFLDAGSFAYIGATKVEFSIGSEAGTSYPDLVLMMALTGNTLGESVMAVNNLHIKDALENGMDPLDAVYEVLLGDPTLGLRSGRVPYDLIEVSGDSYEVIVTRTTPVIYLRLPIEGLKPRIKVDLPSVYSKWYPEDDGLFLYVSTLSSSFSGYFKRGMKIEIELRRWSDILVYLPYVAILLLIVLSLVLLLKGGRAPG